MDLLFSLDLHDYEPEMPVHSRHAVRALIVRDGKCLLQQTARGEYKLPGGGIEPDETHENALIREIREETGLELIPGSMRPIGKVLERRLDRFKDPTRVFEQHSYYYYCQAEDTGRQPQMTDTELSWGLHPVWVPMKDALSQNRDLQADPWMYRDTRFMEWLRDNMPDLAQGGEAT